MFRFFFPEFNVTICCIAYLSLASFLLFCGVLLLVHLFLSKWSLTWPCNSCFSFLHYVYGRIYLFVSLWFLFDFSFFHIPFFLHCDPLCLQWKQYLPFLHYCVLFVCLFISSSLYILSWHSLSLKGNPGPSFHTPLFSLSPFKSVFVAPSFLSFALSFILSSSWVSSEWIFILFISCSFPLYGC
jgi:hypothetical protein